MTRILSDRNYLIRPFGGCTAREGLRLLEDAWKFITDKAAGSTEPCPESLKIIDVQTDRMIPLVMYDHADVPSQRGHVTLILEALRDFVQEGTAEGVIKECHPTQSDGYADLWIVASDHCHYVCEATDKQSWDSWRNRKGNGGAGRGLTKRNQHIERLNLLANQISANTPGSNVRRYHILRTVIAEREATQNGCGMMGGSKVLVEFGRELAVGTKSGGSGAT